jgi:hypothetical protein
MSIKRLVVKFNFFLLKLLRTRRGISVLLIWSLVVFLSCLSVLVHVNNDPFKVDKPFIFIEPITSYFRFRHGSEKKDWHDYGLIRREALRMGETFGFDGIDHDDHDGQRNFMVFNHFFIIF